MSGKLKDTLFLEAVEGEIPGEELLIVGCLDFDRHGFSSYGRLFEVLRVQCCALELIKLMNEAVFSL